MLALPIGTIARLETLAPYPLILMAIPPPIIKTIPTIRRRVIFSLIKSQAIRKEKSTDVASP